MAHQHSQAPHSNTTTLIDATMEAFDGGPLKTTPQEGLSLIGDWLRSLKTSEADNVANTLQKLRTALEGPMIDNIHVRSILLGLAEQSEQWAAKAGGEYPARLNSLAVALRNFGNQLA
ncbi:hypothetical protein [Larkinella arboricola]|uniref:Uncharacterized protein n=1 Tax=Larkinella arboricola TaxID=643671 RepID=A0A327WS41_LARAB|nr:hypothetical protein [Larkinella arboricola]RAJ94047.1 hypothetical protein LX87_03931 [Larkinella arboricola]